MCVLHPCPCFLICYLFYVSFICIRVYAFAIHFMVNCGSAFEPGTSGLPYYCTSICVRSWFDRRATCVDSKKEKNQSQPNKQTNPYIDKYVVCAAVFGTRVVCASARVWSLPGGLLLSQHRRRSIVFRVLFQHTNKQTNNPKKKKKKLIQKNNPEGSWERKERKVLFPIGRFIL